MKTFIFIVFLILVATVWYFYENDRGNGNVPPPPVPPGPELTPAQKEWAIWLNMENALGHEVLDAAASHVWIEKHSDEISIPYQIKFGEPHTVSEPAFVVVPYNIQIAVDPNGDYRVSAREFPPDKNFLKVGDKLPRSFPFNSSFEYSGNSAAEAQELLKSRTATFDFEAKKTYARRSDGGSMVTYMSLEGATIHYNADWIITEIEGSVFKRDH